MRVGLPPFLMSGDGASGSAADPAKGGRLRRVALAVVLSTGFGAQAVAEEIPGPVDAVVLRVVDGDTIRVLARIWLNQTVETLVRLKGIDTPELKGTCQQEKDLAIKAKDLVAGTLAEGDTIQLLDVEPDKYGGRVVARVQTASGRDLSQTLISSGLAHAYDGGRKTPWCP